MTQPQLRLGDENAWLHLERIGEEDWQVTADWCGTLKASYTVYLTDPEVVDFAERVLAELAAGDRVSSRAGVSARVTEGRNNPATLAVQRIGERRHAVHARLTPNGDDEACQLQLEMGPIDADELREAFEELRGVLTP